MALNVYKFIQSHELSISGYLFSLYLIDS